MLDEHDGDLEQVADAADVGHQLRRFRRIHAGGRLVEQQELRPRRQRADDLQPPLRAVGERAGLQVRQVLHFEDGEQLKRPLMRALLGPPVRGQTGERAAQAVAHGVVQPHLHIVLHAQPLEQADVLERAGDAHAVDLVGGLALGIHAVEQDHAARRLVHVGDEIEHGRLAGAVRADEPGDLRAADDKRKVLHRMQAAKVDAEMVDVEDRDLVDVARRHHAPARNGNQIIHYASPAFSALRFASTVRRLRSFSSSPVNEKSYCPNRPDGLKIITTMSSTE